MEENAFVRQRASLFSSTHDEPFLVGALVDLNICPEIVQWAVKDNLQFAVVYDGMPPDSLIPHLPFFVQLTESSGTTEYLLKKTGCRANIFLTASAGVKDKTSLFFDVVGHLQKLLRVSLYGKRLTWFRFYDPVILTRFMKVASPVQLSSLYGKHIKRFYAENEEADTLVAYNAAPVCADCILPIEISHEQKEFFDEEHFISFAESLTNYIAQFYYEKYPSFEKEEIKRRVDSYIAIARQYGLTEKQQYYDFLLLGVSHGIDIYNRDKFKGIFSSATDIGSKFKAVENL